MDDRKLKILAAIVDEYIRTGEPVGSKSVASKMDIAVSSATIRNDMAVLEKMGLLEQPHTSAGRVPTYLGYRLYIKRLMRPKALSTEERAQIHDMLSGHGQTAEAVLENAMEALVELTGCTAVGATNMPKFSVITRVEVIPAGRKMYALLLITSSGDVRNRVCRLEFDLTNEQLSVFTNLVNQSLSGMRVEDLTPVTIQSLAIALGGYMMALSPLLYAVYELSDQLMHENVAVRGESKLLAYADVNAAEILSFLNTKDQLAHLLSDALDGIHVLFGKENDQFVITNSSMIVSKYKIGQGEGSFGLIGPIRLDYAKIIPYVEYFSKSVSKIVEDLLTEGAEPLLGTETHPKDPFEN